jgi:hypothetical protein
MAVRKTKIRESQKKRELTEGQNKHERAEKLNNCQVFGRKL